jgi:hypothetical protein
MTPQTLRKLAAAGFISVFAVFGLAACDEDAAVEDDPALEEDPLEEDPMEEEDG